MQGSRPPPRPILLPSLPPDTYASTAGRRRCATTDDDAPTTVPALVRPSAAVFAAAKQARITTIEKKIETVRRNAARKIMHLRNDLAHAQAHDDDVHSDAIVAHVRSIIHSVDGTECGARIGVVLQTLYPEGTTADALNPTDRVLLYALQCSFPHAFLCEATCYLSGVRVDEPISYSAAEHCCVRRHTKEIWAVNDTPYVHALVAQGNGNAPTHGREIRRLFKHFADDRHDFEDDNVVVCDLAVSLIIVPRKDMVDDACDDADACAGGDAASGDNDVVSDDVGSDDGDGEDHVDRDGDDGARDDGEGDVALPLPRKRARDACSPGTASGACVAGGS